MAMLSIHLQDGFAGDTVIIDVNGDEVFREAEVRTKLLLGYAAITDLQIDHSPAKVEIRLPQKELSETIHIAITGDTYLGISIQNHQIIHAISKQPFGYG